MEIVTKELNLFGKKIILETGKLAKQADSSVVVSCDGTSVLATIVSADEEREVDFLPLVVDVEEKLYAAGKIPGSFFRREGKPTETAMLTARLIDRAIRPIFPDKFRFETQVVISILSTDQVNPPDVLGLLGACAALTASDIPIEGVIAGIRVSKIEDKWIVNPTFKEMDQASLNLVVAGNSENIYMVEAGANEVSEDEIIEGLSFAQSKLGEFCSLIADFDLKVREEKGKLPGLELTKKIRDYLEPAFENKIPRLIDSFVGEESNETNDIRLEIEKIREDCKNHFSDNKKAASFLSSLSFSRILNRILASMIVPEVEEEFEKAIVDSAIPGLSKHERSEIREGAKKELSKKYPELYPEFENPIHEIFDELERKILRKLITEKKIRPDGRKPFQIRKITCEVGVLPRTHGSALFTRGETQVLSIVTLGAYGEKQMLDDLGVEEYKRFIHHYNFPPFSTGEVRPMRGPKRREIGHGALVERALLPLIPEEEEFPYTTRIVSEVLESNGSSSMASVCASSMALMDAGVPLKRGAAVAGIAMGLVLDDKSCVILSDIQGIEDSAGDMDFKVAGTKVGITALQMDIKCHGVSLDILRDALEQAKQGRLFILKVMSEAIEAPRGEISPNAPGMLKTSIPTERIGDLIGPGGKNIRNLIDKYDVEIDVENDGKVFIFGRDRGKVEQARIEIEQMTREPRVGDRYIGTVVRTTSFGAFVELTPGRDGLIHISKLSSGRIDRVEDIVSVGEKVEVEVEAIDDLGRINLRPLILRKPEKGRYS